MKIDYKQLVHINVICDNLGSEISDFSHQLYAIITFDNMSYSLILDRLMLLKTFLKIPSVSL